MLRGQIFNGDTLDLNHLSIIDWRIIKEVYQKESLSLKEIRQATKLPYYTVRYHCAALYKWGLVEKNRSACCIYSAPSSNDLKEDVMNGYYDIMGG